VCDCYLSFFIMKVGSSGDQTREQIFVSCGSSSSGSDASILF
jgi:hypothetical protein